MLDPQNIIAWKSDPPKQPAWHRWRGRIRIPPHAHPLVRQFIEVANKQMTTLQEIADRSGVSRTAISQWKDRRNPSLATFNAALNVLDLELCIRHRKRDQ